MSTEEKLDYDVVIVGAGISGLNFAYSMKTKFPEQSFCILERREEVGGTWSLFKYPGKFRPVRPCRVITTVAMANNVQALDLTRTFTHLASNGSRGERRTRLPPHLSL